MREQLEKLFSSGKSTEGEEIIMIPIEKIKSNPYQPRKSFSQDKIKELAQSLKTYGLLQPIIVRKDKGSYYLVAGERRLLAAKSLGWWEIPAIVREYNDSSMAAIALIENLQRENLNFLEEASGYKKLIEEFGLTQEVLAQRLGKNQSTIANKLRLLKLPDLVKKMLLEEKLSERHARSLLRLKTEEEQLEVLQAILKDDLNVRETDEIVNRMLKQKEKRQGGGGKRVVIRDLRIFINTIRQAVNAIKKAGLKPEVVEKDLGDHWEVTIRLPKKEQ